MSQIIKRDGRIVDFDKSKIENAVLKAFKEVDNEISEYAKEKASNIANYVASLVEDQEISVEEIQDLVENGLMSTKRKDVARAYIRYRYKHNMTRDTYEKLIEDVKVKLNPDVNTVANQNANVDEFSFGGRKGEAANILMKHYALNYLISEKFKLNHLNNRIYIHDLDSYSCGMHNCLSIPFDHLLKNGFNTRQTDVRPAGSINTAFQLLAVIFQLQSLQQFGGVSATHIDWTMVPYVRKSFYKHFKDGVKYIEGMTFIGKVKDDIESISIEDDFYLEFPKAMLYANEMTKRELNQAVEGMFHNLNTLQSRSGNQLPFTSINFGTCTLVEGQMVIEALLNGGIKGVGKYHKTAIFPCTIFQYMKGVNDKPGTPNYYLYKLALESTSKRLYPNYANVDWSNNAGYDINDPRTYFSTMGCRTASGYDINGLGQLKDGRGNIAPATIILPTLAMEAKEKDGDIIENFFEILNDAIIDCHDELLERFNYIASQPASSAKFMYENNLMVGYVPEEGIISALKHGTLAIGQLGLAETLQILIGKDHTTEEGLELGERIEKFFNTKAKEYKEKDRLNWSVYLTPAENLCYTAMNKFKDKYGIIEKVSDKEYFTNSTHVPVYYKISPFEKIDIESKLAKYSNGGCITYVELDAGMEKNIDALETLVNYAMDKDIPYFAINIPIDDCDDCGYSGEMNDTCPECGSHNILHLRRVTGYLSGSYKTSFNKGKQAEVEDRFRHSDLLEV